MKKIFFCIQFIIVGLLSYSQGPPQIQGQPIKDVIQNGLRDLKEDQKDEFFNSIIKNPEIYDKIWRYILKEDSGKYSFLKNVDLKFKTFQNKDNTVSSIGFSYIVDFDFAKSYTKLNNRHSNSFGLHADGNVAIKKETNPNNFLQTNINYSYTQYVGGVLKTSTSQFYTKKNEINDKLNELDDPSSKEALALWDDLAKDVVFTNEYTYNISPYIGYETNQDFSKTQFTPSVLITVGAKAWNDNNPLAKANIFDYPFALLRLLVGTDKSFTPYGATIPTAQFGFTYVVPTNDSIRKKLITDPKPYPRFKFEAGFRTIITRIEKENIFFNTNFRYYKEINAPDVIKAQNLTSHTYFVMALQSTSGFFVSYSTGRLPLDVKSDQVYALGFDYKLSK